MNKFRLGPLWWFVILGTALALVVLSTGPVRGGGYLLALVLAVAGLGRIALPESLIGALVIRSRAVDGAAFLVLAAAVGFIFSVVKLSPLTG
ncbi:hypothetical protein GCM10011492_30820 [Flexivirga endophytica]|uniref:DUF3017 domain-containing protein n=1 Tax=Flexivirga endophytica TaxID=1849103 RepID=A0A916TC60_9MICO|nr:DUF3017 domain-containing protein [Flexivirga endophytica]GGB37950.1 hypothetical protein GCM10011492_30820 [Flexivirga endophytica]GHB45904.1 hypothetical protein GCM10008112_13210 [Flexivirga endophytica]